MTLGEKQELFANRLGHFLTWLSGRGYGVRIKEVYRPPEMAEIYAKDGRGIKNSLHTKSLAADIVLSKDGKVTWEYSDYREPGRYWKTLHPLARWGGDFKNRDAVHFSLEHQGVK